MTVFFRFHEKSATKHQTAYRYEMKEEKIQFFSV